MSGDAIMFAGPSLWGSPLPLPQGIILRAPAACGDLLQALADRPRAIGLVDGVFENGPSVWHKEILAVMAAGVPVLGAASLGAIRAAELYSFGMIGIGKVFAAYRDGSIERDDAVMVSHAPAALGHRPLTVALVDIDAAIAGWAPADRRAMRWIAGRTNFRDRSWAMLDDIFVARTGRPMPPVDRAASLKRRDAELLVAALSADVARPLCAPPPETRWLRALQGSD